MAAPPPPPPPPPPPAHVSAAFVRLGMSIYTPYSTGPEFGAFARRFQGKLASEGLNIPEASMNPTQDAKFNAYMSDFHVIDTEHKNINRLPFMQANRGTFIRAALVGGVSLIGLGVSAACGFNPTLGAVAFGAAAAIVCWPRHIWAGTANSMKLARSASYTPLATSVTTLAVAGGALWAFFAGKDLAGIAVTAGLFGIAACVITRRTLMPLVPVAAIIGIASLGQCSFVQKLENKSGLASGIVEGAKGLDGTGGSVLKGMFSACSSMTATKAEIKGKACAAEVKADKTLARADNNGSVDDSDTHWITQGTQLNFYGTIDFKGKTFSIVSAPEKPDTRMYVRSGDLAPAH